MCHNRSRLYHVHIRYDVDKSLSTALVADAHKLLKLEAVVNFGFDGRELIVVLGPCLRIISSFACKR